MPFCVLRYFIFSLGSAKPLVTGPPGSVWIWLCVIGWAIWTAVHFIMWYLPTARIWHKQFCWNYWFPVTPVKHRKKCGAFLVTLLAFCITRSKEYKLRPVVLYAGVFLKLELLDSPFVGRIAREILSMSNSKRECSDEDEEHLVVQFRGSKCEHDWIKDSKSVSCSIKSLRALLN